MSLTIRFIPTVLLLALSALSSRTKTFLMGAPLLGTFLDISGWFLTMIFPSAALMIMVGGILCHGGTYLAIVVNLYYLWFYQPL